jgi:hypothetical protein
MIIQSILVPRGTSLDVLLAEKGLSWLSEADLEKKQEFEKYMAFPQLDVAKFDRGSLALTKVHDKGVWVVSGKLLDQKDAEKALSLPASPMDAVVAEVPMPSHVVTFGELFDRELRSFIDIVSGAMSQTASDAKARKSAIMGALDSFTSFLSMSLDAVGKEAVEVETALKELQTKSNEEGGQGDDMFKTTEEFAKAVTDIVTGILDKKAAEAKAADDKKKIEEEEARKKAASQQTPPPAGAAVTAEALATLEKNFKDGLEVLTKSVKELTEKTDKLGAQTVTDPAATTGADGKPTTADPNAKKSVFAGVFVKAPKA